MTAIKSRSHWILQTGIVSILVMLLCGCSGSGKHTNPVIPGEPGSDQNIGLSDGIPKPTNRYTLGVWDFHVDPSTQTITGSQRRNADMHLNIVRLLEEACADCLRFDNFDFSTPGQLDVDMTIKHPFESNLALTIFDVKGIFITDMPEPFWVVFAWGEDSPVLVNADGYTWLFSESKYPYNPDEPAMLNYYPGVFTFGEKRSAQTNALLAYGKNNPRRMFLPGTEETRTLQIALPGIPFDFGYVIDVCWALPDADPVIDPLDDFPITANCNEAYKINITIGDGLTTDHGSKAIIEVEVFDHQGHDTIAYYENYNNNDELTPAIYGRLSRQDSWDIWYASPFNNDYYFEFSKATGEDSFLFTAIIEQQMLALGEGKYPLEISVMDTVLDPNFEVIGAYHVIPVFIPLVTDTLPVAEGMAYPVPQTIGKPVQFYDNGSYDPDGGDIVKWEWDWNMDGTFDDEGNPVNHIFDTSGLIYADLRVTDDEGSTRTLFEPLEVMINEGEGWARTWGGSYAEDAFRVDVDDSGNIYVAGYYAGNVDFDPSPLEAYRSGYPAPQGGFDTYISKFDSDGQFKWVRTMGGDYDELPYTLKVGSLGNILVAGPFWLDLTFEGDPSEEVFNAQGYPDIFLCSYSTNGDFQWAKTWGGPELQIPTNLCVDGVGNILMGGNFRGTVDFDPGPGTEFHTAHNIADAFIEKLSPTGDFIWVRNWGSEPYSEHEFKNSVTEVAIDSGGSIYCIGSFEGVVDFDPGPGTDYHEVTGWSPDPPHFKRDIYLNKFTSDGEYQWVKTWGGVDLDRSYGITIDNFDNINTLGYFEGTVDFDPGPGVYELTETSAFSDPFLSRFNTDGDFQWVKSWNAGLWSIYSGLAIEVDNENNIYITGTFYPSADFDPGPGIEERTTNGGWDYYLSKFNMDGELLWVGTWGGPNSEGYGYNVAIDSLGYASVVGGFYELADFDPGPGEDWHYGSVLENPQRDAFLTRFPPDGNW